MVLGEDEDEKANGLRHFSLRVCDKLRTTQATTQTTITYNDVANQLIEESKLEEATEVCCSSVLLCAVDEEMSNYK
jgi:hypothetical protein